MTTPTQSVLERPAATAAGEALRRLGLGSLKATLAPERACVRCQAMTSSGIAATVEDEDGVSHGVWFCSRLCRSLFEVTAHPDDYVSEIVPRLYHGASPKDFGSAWSSDAVRSLRSGRGVFLPGGAGIGKTHYAAALVRATISDFVNENTPGGRPDITWARCPDILIRIRSTFGDKSQERERDVVSAYRRAGLLVIDDMGAEKVTDWSLSALYAILAERIDELRPTIITSNMGLKRIDQWEPRIASRLASFATVILPDIDRRLELRS
jgi:hypothetical protein